MNNIFHAQNRELSKDYGDLTDLTEKIGNNFTPIFVTGYDECVVISGYENSLTLTLKYSLNNGDSFFSLYRIENYVEPNSNVSYYRHTNVQVVKINDNYYCCITTRPGKITSNGIEYPSNGGDYKVVIINIKTPTINRIYWVSRAEYQYKPYFVVNKNSSPSNQEIDRIDILNLGDNWLGYFNDGNWTRQNVDTGEKYNELYVTQNIDSDNIKIPIVGINEKWLTIMQPYDNGNDYYHNITNSSIFDLKLRLQRFLQINNYPRDSGTFKLYTIDYLNFYYNDGLNRKNFNYSAIGNGGNKSLKVMGFYVRIPNNYNEYNSTSNFCFGGASYSSPIFYGLESHKIDNFNTYPLQVKNVVINNTNITYISWSNFIDNGCGNNDHRINLHFLTKSTNGGVDNEIIYMTKYQGFKYSPNDGINERLIDNFYVSKTGRSFLIEKFYLTPQKPRIIISDNDFNNKNNIEKRINDYGLLYNYYSAINNKLAPAGWHVATYTNYSTVTSQYGGYPIAGAYMKSKNNLWKSCDLGFLGDDEPRFNAYSSGFLNGMVLYDPDKNEGLVFTGRDYGCRYWAPSSNMMGRISLYQYTNNVELQPNNQNDLPYPTTPAYSIRLVKDDNVNPGTLTDYDGNVYKTIEIGNKIWIDADWKCTHLNDGTPIELVTDIGRISRWMDVLAIGQTTPAYCIYNNDINQQNPHYTENDFKLP